MTADGSVWVTVAQLSQAEEEFHELHGRYGELVEMTNPLAGPAPDVMAGRVGSYAITIKLRNNGYILAANPEFGQSGHSLAAFHGDQTGNITYNSSGEPAGRHDESFWK